MSIRTLEQVKSDISQYPPIPCDLMVGDIVTFTNEFGVTWPDMVIIGFERKNEIVNNRIVYLDKGAYWFPVPIDSLEKQ